METLKKYKPVVYTELLRKHAARFDYHPNEVIRFMRSLGYRCATLRDSKMTNIEFIDDETKETNFFFFQIDNRESIIKHMEVN